MRKRTSVDAIRVALFASLGLVGGCGGSVATTTGDAAPGPDTEAAKGEAEASPLGPQRDATTPGLNTDASPAEDAALPSVPPDITAPADSAAPPDSPAPRPGMCGAHPCANPTPLLIGGVDTGYDTCQGGAVRRRAAMECPSPPRNPGGMCPPYPANSGYCGSDKDCVPNGFCVLSNDDGGTPCSCQFGCVRDSDCASGEICVCADPVGQCQVANCATGASCQSGCDCIQPAATFAFACQTPDDNCVSDSDCAAVDPSSGPAPSGCYYTGRVVCHGPEYSGGQSTGLKCQSEIACPTFTGRPFLIRGDERLAAPARRADWLASTTTTTTTTTTTATARAHLAEHWTRVALMEHASIAAFARFTLHLLAVGAPPDLVARSQQAMGDETEHARLSFALASAYAGQAVGPGPLAIDGSLDDFSVEQMLHTLVREGCVGETLAAAEAAEALGDSRDGAVRNVLRVIARDELRHAELAWKTLRWMVTSGLVTPTAAREAVTAALRASSARPSVMEQDLRAFGVLDLASREEVRVAVTTVVVRCAAALFDDARVAGTTARPARAA